MILNKINSILILIIILNTAQKSFGQTLNEIAPEKNIKVQTGFMFDNYNSAGFRLFVEYQQQIKKQRKLYWGIGYDTKYASFRPATDIYDPPELYTSNFSFNLHYHLKLWKDKILWDLAIGPAITYAYNHHESYRSNTNQNYLLTGIHIGANFNLKLGKHVYFETAPLIFIPAGSDFYLLNRKAYHSVYTGYGAFIQYSVLPLGLRFIL